MGYLSHGIHVGVDVDGVIADFNTGFMDLFVALTKEDRFGTPRADITTWNYATDQFGYTKDQDRAAWKAVIGNVKFWENLPAYKGTVEFLTTLHALPVMVTFITSRVGTDVVGQTTRWLEAQGYNSPSVIISSNKGASCRRIGVSHYVDDKNENIQDVVAQGGCSRVFMFAQPYNVAQPGSARITDLGVVLDAIAADLKTAAEARDAKRG